MFNRSNQRGHLRAGRSRQRVYLSSSCCMDFLMVLRTARTRRVNPRWRGALVIPGFLLGTTAVSASRVRFLRSSLVVCKTQKWGSAAWVCLKGESGWGSSAPHKQTRSYFIPAAYILIINRFSPTIDTRSTAVYPGTVSIRHNTTIIAIIA